MADEGWIAPMLATTGAEPFTDPAWLFEPKLDGIRGLAWRTPGGVELWSRNHRSLVAAHPGVVAALEAQEPTSFVLDGEVVAFEDGRPSFARLQQHPSSVTYVVFDVLLLDGEAVTDRPLVERRRLLVERFVSAGALVINSAVVGEGQALFDEMCRRGWEGVVAKRAASPYVSRRSPDWLKLKCARRQEVVVGGFTDPKGQRSGFGALLVGVHRDGRLHYAGKVGTGFSQWVLADLHARLEQLEQPGSPFDEDRLPERHPHWVRPELVAEVTFAEWTTEGRLRHSVYVGLRQDKDPAEVVREEPA